METIFPPWPGWVTMRRIGNGGYGTVYEIKRTNLAGTEERAAMKVIRFPQDDSEIRALLSEGYSRKSIQSINQERLDKIIEEYSLMSKMKGHRNIVRCDDCDTVLHQDEMGWDVFIRMELLKPLSQELQEKSFTERDIITLGKDICRALIQCKQYGIVHRDIKPENIFVNKYGDYKLGDFGISRTMEHNMTATRAGSYKYMAPEVFKGMEYGSSVDIYSLGLVLYWLLNNYRMPFISADHTPSLRENESALQQRMAGIERMPEPIHGSTALKRIVMKACSFHAEDRYSDPESFFNDLSLIDRPVLYTDDIIPSDIVFSCDDPSSSERCFTNTDDSTVALEVNSHERSFHIAPPIQKKEAGISDADYSITKTYKVTLLDSVLWGINQEQDDTIAKTTVSDLFQIHRGSIPSFCEITVYLSDHTPVFLWTPAKQEIEYVDSDFNTIRSIAFSKEDYYDSTKSYMADQSEIYQVDLPLENVSWGEDEEADFATSRAVIIEIAEIIERFDFNTDDYSIVAFQPGSDEKAFWYDEHSKALVLYDRTGHNQRASLYLDDSIYQVNEIKSIKDYSDSEFKSQDLPKSSILPIIVLFFILIGLILFHLSPWS